MFAKLQNSWALVKASVAVLRADKELIIFPIVSSIGLFLVSVAFFAPMLVAGLFDSIFEGEAQVFGLVIGFVFYVVQYSVIIFANSALIGAAMIRLRGGDPTVADGFRIASKHLGSILGYALISATVGMILRWISERGKGLGQIASSILGMAWNLATYLVVPVLVIEGVGPWEAVKRSAGLLKRTWGEQIVGNFSIGAIFGLISVLAILISIPVAFVLVTAELYVLLIPLVLLLVVFFTLMGLISSTLNGIYVAAVYRYAADGEASGFFSEEMVRGAFREKTSDRRTPRLRF
jgi:hypothetical protein